MGRIGFLKGWALAAGFGLAAAAFGQPPPQAPLSGDGVPATPLEAQGVQEELRRQASELERFRRDESEIAAALDAVGRTLQRHRRRAALLEREMTGLEANIASTTVAVDDLARRIRSGQEHLARRLVALYKSQALGAAHYPAPDDSFYDWLRHRKSLEQIIAADDRALAELLSYQAELGVLQERLERQKADFANRLQEQQEQQAAAAREKRNREHLLARIRSRLELQQAALAALQQAADELESTLSTLDRRARSGSHRPAAPFAAAKGLLIFPVKGKIVKKFGPFTHSTLNVHGFRSGIEIAADRGEPVMAVHAGQVVFADWFKGYGNVLIIDHGQHYYSVHAYLEEVFKPVDSPVEAGEVVATVGDSGAMGTPGLYFELRQQDSPLDPLEWLRRN